MNKIKTIFGNGLYWGIIFFVVSFCIGYFNSDIPLKTILMISIPIAFLALIINGAMYSRFTKPLKTLEKIEIKIEDDEDLAIATPANHLINDDMISGKLGLTNKRLIFKTYQQEEFAWTKSELHTIVYYRSFKNKGGEFTTNDKNNRKLVFEVDQLKLWKDALSQLASS